MAKTKLDKEMRPTLKLQQAINCKLPKITLKSSLPKGDYLREHLRRTAESARS